MYTPQDMQNEFIAGQKSAISSIIAYAESRIKSLDDLRKLSEEQGLEELSERYSQRIMAFTELLETLDAIS